MPDTDNLGELDDTLLLLAKEAQRADRYVAQRDSILDGALKDAKAAILAHLQTQVERAVVDYRDRASTNGRPLGAPPLIVDMPPCEGCGSTKYADWYIHPHQVYNSVCAGGNGTHCLPCFAKKLLAGNTVALTTTQKEVQEELVPCTWCDRQIQEKCPDCPGTGFVEEEQGEKHG